MGDIDWGQGFQGAAGGAAAGTAIMPGWGTAIGAGAGFLGSLLGDDSASSYQDQMRRLAGGYGRRTAPQTGPAAQAGNSRLTQNRAGLIAQLEAQARGEGPSAAAIQMREAMDRSTAAQTSMAAGAGGRGVNVGGAYRQAANNMAATQAQGARDTATLRSQEQMNAEGQLGSVIGQGINSDNSVGMFNAGQTNDAARSNMMAKLQMLGINDESQLRALLAAMGVAGPGMGTQLMGAGASAVPGILQYRQQRGMGQGGGYSPQGLSTPPGIGPNDWTPGSGPGGWTPQHG